MLSKRQQCKDFVFGATQNFLVDHFGSNGLKASIWLGKHYNWKKGV